MRMIVIERGPRGLATRRRRDRCEGVGLEMASHVLAGCLPDSEEHALSLVITGPVLVRLAEVAEDDRAVDRRDDLGEADLVGRPGKHVATADTPLGTHQPGALQGEEDLFEIGLR